MILSRFQRIISSQGFEQLRSSKYPTVYLVKASDLAVIEPQRAIRCGFATLMMTAGRPIANSREHTILPSPIDYVQRSPVPVVESFQRPWSNLPESRTDRTGCALLERTTGTQDHLLLLATRFSSDHPLWLEFRAASAPCFCSRTEILVQDTRFKADP